MSLHRGEIASADTTAAPARSPRDVTQDGPPFKIIKSGDWLHGDGRIERLALARLFASILYREPDGSYWLKNPAEICHVTVEAAPYIATHLHEKGDTIFITTTLDETFPLDAGHPLTMQDGVPHVMLRHGCAARATTQLYYALVALARLIDGHALVTSSGVTFDLGPVNNS